MKISVIIPSRRRYKKLFACLHSLSKQSVQSYEIIIVENDFQNHYQKIIKDFNNLNIRLILEKKLGKSKARNLGIKKSKGDILAFLDDDCFVDKNWIKIIDKNFSQNKKLDVLLGRSIEKEKTLLIEAYNYQYENFFLKSRINFKTGEVVCGGALNTRNFAVKKLFLTKNNIYFDNIYDKFGFAEDTDFGEILEKNKANFFYDSSLKVVHHEKSTLLNLLKKKFINGRAIFYLKNKNIYHEFGLEKKNKYFVFERIKNLIVGKNFYQIFLLISYLNFIILFYKFGIFYERIRYFLAGFGSKN